MAIAAFVKNNSMLELTKKYLKDVWNLIWSKTDIDEKAIETIIEIKRRKKLTEEELKDVIEAIKEFGNQIEDIPNALRGKERKGRKSKKS